VGYDVPMKPEPSRWVVGRVLAAALLVGGLAGGCAGGGAANGKPAPSPTELRQTVEALQKEVGELRAQLQATRRVAATQQDLLGMRAELEAIQAALQALLRDVDQRQLEGFQAVDRRLVALGARVDQLTAAVRRAEASIAEGGERAEAALPAPAPPAPTAPRASPPPPAPAGSAPATGTVRRVQRVSTAEVAGETRVTVEADGPLGPRVFTLDDPPRLILDFDNSVFGFDRAPIAVSSPLVERLRFIQLRATPASAVRLIVALKRAAPFWIEPRERGLVLHVGSEAPAR
jgi:AMIN domain-containing protein